MRRILAALASIALAAHAAQPSPEEIVQRSVAANEADWGQAPNYSYTEREVTSAKNGPKKVRTYEVTMIEGSPYERLIAVNDQPLSPGEQQREEQKYRREVDRRKSESPQDRAKRIAKYQKEQRRDHLMMKEMTVAFQFKLVGDDTVDGHDVYVLEATPKAGYQPNGQEERVLLGMKGKMWIDKEHYQWVKVEAQVIKPVAFHGFLAKVEPGTSFLLEQEPVSATLWLPKHFSMNVKAAALGFISKDATHDETYTDYKRIPKTHETAPAVNARP
jgi:outer membrane lipoprotein-sorting protein